MGIFDVIYNAANSAAKYVQGNAANAEKEVVDTAKAVVNNGAAYVQQVENSAKAVIRPAAETVDRTVQQAENAARNAGNEINRDVQNTVKNVIEPAAANVVQKVTGVPQAPTINQAQINRDAADAANTASKNANAVKSSVQAAEKQDESDNNTKMYDTTFIDPNLHAQINSFNQQMLKPANINQGLVAPEQHDWISDTLRQIDNVAKTVIKIPSLQEGEKFWDNVVKGTPLEQIRNDQRKAIYSNPVGFEAMKFGENTYNWTREHPGQAIAAGIATYTGGELLGAGVEGLGGLVEGRAATVAATAESPVIQKIATVVANNFKNTLNAIMALDLSKSGIETGYNLEDKNLISGAANAARVLSTGDKAQIAKLAADTVRDAKDLDVYHMLKFSSEVAGGAAGYSRGGEIARDPISIIPGLETVKVQEVFPGSSARVKDVDVGKTLSIAGKTIASWSKDTGFIRGVLDIPEEKVTGKLLQPYTKEGQKAFDKTVLNLADDVNREYYNRGKAIANAAYNAKSPVTKPKTFEVSSRNIPDEFKPVVKTAIKEYGKGLLFKKPISVYGSVAQKAQMEGYLTRAPGDIEIDVGKVNDFVKMFNKVAAKSGFKKGVDYKIEVSEDSPKVYFKDSSGDFKSKGVEIFSHSGKIEGETGLKEVGEGKYSIEGLPYGFKEMKSIKAESIRMMKLQEQAARKLAGSTHLLNGEFVPTHEGRIKDVRDLIEIGVGYRQEKGIGKTSDVIEYTKAAAKKFPGIIEPGDKNYSPVAKYIIDNGKLPTKAEIKAMMAENPIENGSESEKELIFDNSGSTVKDIVENIENISRAVRSPAGFSFSAPVINKASSEKLTKKDVKGVKKTENEVFKNAAETSARIKQYSEKVNSVFNSKAFESKNFLSGSKGPGSKTPGSKSPSESKGPGSKTPGSNSPSGSKGPGSKTPGSKSPSGSKGPGSKTPGSKSPSGSKGPGSKTPGSKSPSGSKGPGSKGPRGSPGGGSPGGHISKGGGAGGSRGEEEILKRKKEDEERAKKLVKTIIPKIRFIENTLSTVESIVG